jgi:hypothetical protein
MPPAPFRIRVPNESKELLLVFWLPHCITSQLPGQDRQNDSIPIAEAGKSWYDLWQGGRVSVPPKHPLAEVFGFPTNNLSPEADRYRRLRLCPFNNKVPSCTKDKAENPLGVCTVYEGDKLAITCPIRFREDWLIAEDAAAFSSQRGPPGLHLQKSG